MSTIFTIILILLQLAPDVLTVTINPPNLIAVPPISQSFTGKAASSYGYLITWWKWDYGDGIWCTGTPANSNFCGMTVVHNFPKIGNYNVTFTATDSKGTTSSVTAVVSAVAPCATLPPVCKGGLLPQTATGLDITNYMKNNMTQGCRFMQPPRCSIVGNPPDPCKCTQ